MLTETDARSMLLRGNVSPLPLQLEVVADDDPVNRGRVDFLIDLIWEGRRRGFAAEYKAVATPKKMEAAISQAKSYVSDYPDRLPMVLVPHLSEEVVDRLLDENVSGLDFSGNVVVTVPGEWLIVRTGRANRFPSSQSIKNVYEGKSSLVGRVLLSRPTFDLVKEVQAEIERRGGAVSMGTVSKVLSALEDDLVVTKDQGIRLTQPGRLLDRLASHYDGPGVRGRWVGKATLNDSFYEDIVEAADRAGVRVAGRSEALYVVSPTSHEPTRIYVSGLGDWIDSLSAQETDRFANVEFVETRDEGAFFDLVVRDGFRWCSALQIYLELTGGGKREREAAAQLRGDLLDHGKPGPAPARADGS